MGHAGRDSVLLLTAIILMRVYRPVLTMRKEVKSENMKKLLVILTVIVCLALIGTALAISSSTDTGYYNFDQNVPNTGFRVSSTKTVPAGTDFAVRLDACIANNDTDQGKYGCLFRPVNASNLVPLGPFIKVLPGSAKTILLKHLDTKRAIKIELQAVGDDYVTARGYWFY
jgi:hypothetical protein